MEQKLVQRCETEIVADACNASYWVSSCIGKSIDIGLLLPMEWSDVRCTLDLDKEEGARSFCVARLSSRSDQR